MKRIWECDICQKQFNTRKELFAHKKEHGYICQHCGLKVDRGYLLGNHVLHCKLNPKYKENKNKIAKASSIAHKGEQRSPEMRAKVSASMKKYYKEHPELVPYRIHHSSKESYPEKYFRKVLISEGISYYKDFYFNGYFLDFAIKDLKIDFEVDGSQHRNDPKIVEHDKLRNQVIQNNGWTVIRIFWPTWQKLTKQKKKNKIFELKLYLTGQKQIESSFIQLV